MRSVLSVKFLLLAAALALLAANYRPQLQAATVALYMQSALYINCLGPISLFLPGFSFPYKSSELLPELDMGVWNVIKMKWIYVLRYFMKDQFYLQQDSYYILKNVESRLTKQFAMNGWTEETFANIPVPSFQADNITSREFFDQYVKMGIPVILKNFSSIARDNWSPNYFSRLAGDHVIDVINTTAISSVRMSLSEFEQSQMDPSNKDILYIRALSDVFDLYPQLEAEVGVHQFDDYMKGRYLTSQIFMGMKRLAGTSFHCANFNNLFFQIKGRKKWTFVSPDYNVLMYPMFNPKSMDVASFLTNIILPSAEDMERYFPLYKFAPKMTAVLEPGDVLFNPPWQWHMIDNLEDYSIGVATRWFLNPTQHYQNAVHSALQFFSSYIWGNYYNKALNLQRGIRVHKASNTVPIDERFNFGAPGSAKTFRPKIFTSSVYEERS